MRRALRSLAPPLALLGAWGLASAAFSAVSRDGGLVTPEGVVDPVVVGVGLLAIALRLAALFVALPVLVMRGVLLLGRLAGRTGRGDSPGARTSLG